MMNNSVKKVSVLIVTGISLFCSSNISAQERTISDEPKLKFDDVLSLLKTRYVDTVNFNVLVEDAIKGMMKDLDPHSEYYTAEEYEKMNEPLQGNFEGIGVQFNITRDTIVVQSPISGGPSEKLGIRSGDKIVKVEGKSVAGIKITNNDVIKKLRGDKGTIVNVSIYRRGVKDLIEYAIVRDKIPIFSVDASYMLTPEIGYIKVNRFAETTMDEFRAGLDKLKAKNIKHLVLDLRGNSGGYLKTAIELSDEFLKDREMIVYTEGASSPKRDYIATTRGAFEQGKLVVLIDEGSASASEIVSGAVQDWDRGLIIGRRSFGKGLVQGPFRLRDNSWLKITTARYYTPTGRCIQRPYDEGVDEYRKEDERRYKSGELYHQDSIKFADSLKYYTPNNRLVYGGGGIMPDLFMPLDTSENSRFLTEIYAQGIINDFVNEYTDERRQEFASLYPDFETFDKKFVVDQKLFDEFLAYADKNLAEKSKADSITVVDEDGEDVKIANTKVAGDKTPEEIKAEGIKTSGAHLKNRIKAYIARSFWQTEAFFRIINQASPEVQKAIKVINDKTFEEMKIANK
jgi:carboxyl-terminal processing protease